MHHADEYLNSLADPRVRKILDEIWAMQAQVNPAGESRLKAAMVGRSEPFGVQELVNLCAGGSFAAPPQIGQLLYALVRAMRPTTVLEFGTGHGFSTLHIAAALRDNGEGQLVSAELHPEKAEAARVNLALAGLNRHANVLEGEASEVLAAIPNVDLLYLDGWTEFYLPVLWCMPTTWASSPRAPPRTSITCATRPTAMSRWLSETTKALSSPAGPE